MNSNDTLAARLTQAILYGKSPSDEIDSGVDRRYLYVSEVSNCIRQSYYKFTGSQQDEDSEDNGPISFIMSYGNMFESVISERLAEIGIPRIKLRRGTVIDKISVSGETDPIVKFEDKYIILECKATHRANYQTIIDKFTKYGEYPSTYYDQLQMYLWLTPKADLGMLVIGNRDMRYNDKIPPFIILNVERNTEWKTKNIHRIKELSNALDVMKPPKREYTPNDWQCKVCAYLKLCYSGVDDIAKEPNQHDNRLSEY